MQSGHGSGSAEELSLSRSIQKWSAYKRQGSAERQVDKTELHTPVELEVGVCAVALHGNELEVAAKVSCVL